MSFQLPLLFLPPSTVSHQGIVFEENEPEVGGLFVADLSPGGAAEGTGAIRAGDQLLAVAGESVAGKTFDEVMGALGGAPPETSVKFYRGPMSGLAASVAASGYGAVTAGATEGAAVAPPRPTATAITVLDGGSSVAVVSEPTLLRTALVGAKVELYAGMAKLTNCGGTGTCGTCVVDVVEGAEALSPRTAVSRVGSCLMSVSNSTAVSASTH